jgi:hypothetical protein
MNKVWSMNNYDNYGRVPPPSSKELRRNCQLYDDCKKIINEDDSWMVGQNKNDDEAGR